MTQPHIALIGLSYHTAPIGVREQLSCSVADMPPATPAAGDRYAQIQEMVVLSTCNRTELYAAFDGSIDEAKAVLTTLLSEMTGVETAVFSHLTYFHTDQVAAEHLFRVAAGLESLVLGEPQILGQVTDAYMTAVKTKTIGSVLTELFRIAIRTGKRARSETAISQNPMSTSGMAIAQAQKLVGDLTQQCHLIIGLGEMGRLALKRLKARGVQQISLINRTNQRAADLAEQHDCTAHHWHNLAAALAEADVVISATGSSKIIIDADMVRQVMAQRPQRPLILLDIAVPRDIAAEVRHIEGVHLHDADELRGHLDEALAARQQEVPKIEQIIAEEMTALTVQLQTLAVKPIIVNLRQKAELIRQQEFERTLRHLGDVDPQTLKHLQHFSRSLINKLLHEPTVRLKASAAHDDAAVYANTINDLFGLTEQVEA